MPTTAAPYERLADLARALWLPVLVCSAGQTARRLDGLPRWTEALTQGTLPAPDTDLGDPEALAPLRQAIGELGLPGLARGQPALAEQVLRTTLWHLDRLIDRPAQQTRAEAVAAMVQAFRDEWQQDKAGWEQLLTLLPALGEQAQFGTEGLRGQLQRREWHEALRIAERLRQLPELARFIDQVGRARRQHEQPAPPPPEPAAAPPRPLDLVALETRLVDQPSAVRGVKRSGQIARMLASEAALLGHPTLKRLWRARLAESQLLTYEDEAVLTQWVTAPDTRHHQTADVLPPEPLGQGPMLVCLDTSGSMRGAPENVAKACVLQAMRSAHAARRGCRLLAFGGPGELLEHELAHTSQGLQALLDLMGQNFDGGTDVQTPLERAIDRVAEQAWALADILIVSDGEFGVTPATLARLRACKQHQGLRVHGILIGDRETIGLLEVCDSLHWVRDWRRHDPSGQHLYADGFSPVHSRSLTALYFPNAVRR